MASWKAANWGCQHLGNPNWHWVSIFLPSTVVSWNNSSLGKCLLSKGGFSIYRHLPLSFSLGSCSQIPSEVWGVKKKKCANIQRKMGCVCVVQWEYICLKCRKSWIQFQEFGLMGMVTSNMKYLCLRPWWASANLSRQYWLWWSDPV